jgi:hypothetical protein
MAPRGADFAADSLAGCGTSPDLTNGEAKELSPINLGQEDSVNMRTGRVPPPTGMTPPSM